MIRYKIHITILLISQFLTLLCLGQETTNFTVESKLQWEEVLTLQNEYISLLTVPATGRTLEFNLHEHPFLWKNSKMYGKSFPHNDSLAGSQWSNFGGHRITLLPRLYRMNTKGKWLNRWPPPAIIGACPYSFYEDTSKSDKSGFSMTSHEQVLPSPSFSKNKFYQAPEEEKLMYSRTMHIEDGSSKVYITHQLKNVGDKPLERAMLLICQHLSNHGDRDGQNYWAYFPVDSLHMITDTSYAVVSTRPEKLWELAKRKLNLTEADTTMKAHYHTTGKHFRGEILPGIYGMHYDYVNMGGLYAITSKGWVAYVDELKGKTMVRLFEPFDTEKKYDLGANLSIFNSSASEGYLETEIRTPMVKIPSGGVSEFSEIWGATTCYGPILDANKFGAISQHLECNHISGLVSGSYGVFNKGYLMLKIYNRSKVEVYSAKLNDVSPSGTVNVHHIMKFIPSDINSMELLIHRYDGSLLGKLDTRNL